MPGLGPRWEGRKLVCMTVEEAGRIKQLAVECKLPTSTYIRRRALGWEPPRHSRRPVDAAVRELEQIAKTLRLLVDGAEPGEIVQIGAGEILAVRERVSAAQRSLMGLDP